MADDDAVEVIYRDAIREIEEDDDPEASDQPLSRDGHERVRAFIKAGFRSGMTTEQVAALREAAVQDLLQALHNEPHDPIEHLRKELAALGEALAEVKRARPVAKARP
ncbi:hypothetical protein KBX06_18705 [Micromonospora sp. C31]|uniref:hypothetical protein n=1 Tax=Micromonospora sp. C31 TaxID=2824876 RepID=UPI001B3921CD|nr:hypothetical protein [Micromonospora sp. C31]MBQ1075180.1 hypothetical protein [Micromonospora sp. C31]